MYWADLLGRLPVVAVTGVNYYVAAHGEPSANLPWCDHQGMLLETSLAENRWPTFRRYGGLEEKLGQQFALGSLAYAMFAGSDDPPYAFRKAWVKHLCYEEEYSLSELTESGDVTPLSWVMVDFDCPPSSARLTTILEILPKIYPLGNWAVFDSGGGYYFLLEDLVSVRNVPRHWGKLVTNFAVTALPNRRHTFEGIGLDLQKYWDNSRQLRRLARDILDMICHYDDPIGEKIPFIIDLRHMAHSMDEWLKYSQNQTKSFGFLRLSQKSPYNLPPVAVAKYSPQDGVKLLFDGTVYQRPQLPLPGFP